MAHSTDYASRHAVRACAHPRDRVRQIGEKLWKCCACGEWRGVMSGPEHDAHHAQGESLARYNQAMRLKGAKRRHWILTGEMS